MVENVAEAREQYGTLWVLKLADRHVRRASEIMKPGGRDDKKTKKRQRSKKKSKRGNLGLWWCPPRVGLAAGQVF